VGGGEGDAEDGVGAELGLRLGASRASIARSTADLVERVGADEGGRDLRFTLATAFWCALPRRVLSPSRSSIASCSPVEAPEGTAARRDAAGEAHVDLDGRIAARVDDFAGVMR